MRRLFFSIGLWTAALAPGAWAQTSGGSGGAAVPQIPFGQTYKNFVFPYYQNGQLSYTLTAVSAKGLTVNRAQTTDLKILIYTDGKVTTTITSPLADLYVAERKMRTHNTVKIDRADVTATAQTCDFDVPTQKYILRQNVRVVLKHFDVGGSSKPHSAAAAPTSSLSGTMGAPLPTPDIPVPAAEPVPSIAPRTGDGLLDMPGAASTNTPSNP